MIFLEAIIFAVLLFIAWQDFKFRAVYWWLFVMLLMGLAIKQSLLIGFELVVDHMTYNSIFLVFQLLCLTAYFSFKERRPVNIFNGYFGLGDLFFLIGITVYFSFLNFMVYYALSLVFVILASIIARLATTQQNEKIPLAGYQAILLLFFLISSHLLGVDWGSDQWHVNYING